MALLGPAPILFLVHSPMGFHNAAGPAMVLAFAWIGLLVPGFLYYGWRTIWLLPASPFAIF